jgi:heme-degrading monooxygenase HmoA
MYQLAEINIGRILAPLDDPLMAGFVEKLDEMNALADRSPGFIWRLQTNEGDATSIRPYEDERILVNMSVWASLETFADYAYKSAHREVMKQRRRWFERFDGPYMALWWVPQGHIPTVEEGKERLEYLRTHGETAYTFSLKRPFPPAELAGQEVAPILEECPA